MRVLLVGSSGGHLAQLLSLEPWWREHERLWVTVRKADSESLLQDERVVWGHFPTTRNLRNLIRNLWLSVRVVRRFRPDLVVSTGAGIAFPFFLLGRAHRARTVYIEVYDRIDSRTLTGRLCYPISDLFLLQWEEQRSLYPKGRVIGQLL
jgi:UDP-N-acetylglucosamine:LPS N-acetylglucosamine transferase